jgi:hypothetical protein
MIALKDRCSRRFILASCAAAAVAALAIGCGGGDDDKDPASSAPAKPARFAITATAEGKNKAMEFPSTVKAGLVAMTLTNSDTVPRSAQLLRIVGNHSTSEVLAVVTDEGGKIPDWVQDGGGVPSVKPGASSTATQVLAPGRYVLLDDDETAGDSAKTNAEIGATGEFTVTGERRRAFLPAQPATITATDAKVGNKETYGFRLEGLKSGTNRVHFQNTGGQLHHALFVPLVEGATLARAKSYLSTEGTPQGEPPVDFSKIVGTKVIDAGIEQNISLDLDAGRYAVVCFISDRDGGKPHVAKGMIEEVKVE